MATENQITLNLHYFETGVEPENRLKEKANMDKNCSIAKLEEHIRKHRNLKEETDVAMFFMVDGTIFRLEDRESTIQNYGISNESTITIVLRGADDS